MRILVIEDDAKVARFIQAGLEEEGNGVDVLHDGTDAGVQAHAVDRSAPPGHEASRPTTPGTLQALPRPKRP